MRCQAVRAPGVKWTLLALTRELPAGATPCRRGRSL
jgi:hypothetical protein